ncbi:MAG TPA: lipoyl(octanoyl) transferase LipB [Bacteroidota bacterium]|nr:lipoyl(octanoyl) transferase LipB [Bacteroidota bacterium]
MADTTKHISTVLLGRTRYADAWDIQRKVFDARVHGRIGDVLLLTEHEPVYTLGKGANEHHVLASAEELERRSIDIHWIDRGGDVTFHGPGQIVGYPIIDLNNFYLDVHRYLRDLEEMLIRTLAVYHIEAGRSEGYTGVWVGNEKAAAIGVKMQRWITMHGFALNVSTDLSYFERIIPCGIFHKGVTSMQQLTGAPISIGEVMPVVINNFESVFGVCARELPLDELLAECADTAHAAKDATE